MSSQKPNILLLFTDQQRFDTIAAAGYSHMQTPNLDRLLNEGCLFTNAYTPNPVCVPARHNLITGLPASRHKYYTNNQHPLNPDLPTLPQILAHNGYDTQAIGKMHFQPARNHNGFLKMQLMEEAPRYRADDEYAMYLKANGYEDIQNIHGIRNLLYMTPQRSQIPEAHHGSTWVGDRSVEYIQRQDGSRPFFLWSSWIAPHPPFDLPDNFADLYKDADIPAAYDTATELSPSAKRAHGYCDMPEEKKKEYLRRVREFYYGAISLVDKNIGKILDTLEATGQIDNTIIIFTSDHGEMLGDHNCFQKMKPYDSCARIPFIIRYPEKFTKGSRENDFVDLNDIMPTILDITGLRYPGAAELPGASILNNTKDRDHQYMEYAIGASRWCSMRDKQYKYNYYYGGGFEELFDMVNDNKETTNLLESDQDNPGVKDAYARLKHKLLDHESKWGPDGYSLAAQEFITFKTPETLKSASKDKPARVPCRNAQFPMFVEHIKSEEELKRIKPYIDELIAVTQNEELVNLHELDLESWLNTQDNPITPEYIKDNLAEYIKRIRQEGL